MIVKGQDSNHYSGWRSEEGSGKQEEYFTFYASYFHGENIMPQLKRGKRGGTGVVQRLGIAVFEKTLFAPSSYDASQPVARAGVVARSGCHA
jgi:hypothetical protein